MASRGCMPLCAAPYRMSAHTQPGRIGAYAKILLLTWPLPYAENMSRQLLSPEAPSYGPCTGPSCVRNWQYPPWQSSLICSIMTLELTFHSNMNSSRGRLAASPTVICLVRLSDILMVRTLLRSARHTGRNSGNIAGLFAGQAVVACKEGNAMQLQQSHTHDQGKPRT